MTLELVIAVCALGLTIYQAWLTRQHNRLSFRPHLQWSHCRDLRDDGFHYRCVIQNFGLGPAVISKIELFRNGQLFEPQSSDPLKELIGPELPKECRCRFRTTSFPKLNYAIKADSEYKFLEIEFPGMTESTLAKLEAPAVDVRIVYKSIYGEEQILDSRR